jgi:hypothetical protein
MTMRRQALRSREPLVTISFLSLILSLFFALPSLLANAQDAQPNKVAYAQPGDMNTGALLLQSGEDSYVEATRLNTDAAITVTGTIAKAMAPGRNQSRGMLPSVAGALNYAFDGSAATPPANVAPTPDTSTVLPNTKSDVPNVETSVTPTVSSEESSGQAEPSYPLLPLTVVPKPDASPIATLKAPCAFDQRLVVLALLLTILSAVTLVMWRYHRRDYASPRRTERRI